MIPPTLIRAIPASAAVIGTIWRVMLRNRESHAKIDETTVGARAIDLPVLRRVLRWSPCRPWTVRSRDRSFGLNGPSPWIVAGTGGIVAAAGLIQGEIATFGPVNGIVDHLRFFRVNPRWF